MKRLLVIDQDRDAGQRLGLECLGRGMGVALADNVCEGVRVLLGEAVSLIVVDAALLRLGVHEHATLFERVAPGIPVVVTLRASTPLEARVALELAGFRVLPRPVLLEDLAKLMEEVERS
jgi:DNA-binding NtrC family response regulator